MSTHALEIVSDDGELSLRLVCHAVKGATCRLRPADSDVEEWPEDYAGDMIDTDCWAVEWASEAGIQDGVRFHTSGTVVSVPVALEYDGCVLLHLVEPHTMLAELAGGTS